MPLQTIDIPASLIAALDQEARQRGRSRASLILEAVSSYLDRPIKTVFQVWTSGALVAGVYDREVSVRTILAHGNFGLGTFAGLDGEMVIVDGRVYQVQGTGRVCEAPNDAGAPFAVAIGGICCGSEIDRETRTTFSAFHSRQAFWYS